MLNIKDLYSIFQQAGKISEYQKIIELLDDSLKAREMINKLEAENRQLREQLKLRGHRRHERNSYWLSADDVQEDGPYCTCCWDEHDKQIRLHPRPNGAFYVCPSCKNQVEVYPEKNQFRGFSSDRVARVNVGLNVGL